MSQSWKSNSRNDDRSGSADAAVQQRVQQAITEMHEWRRRFQDERQLGEVSEMVHLSFQASLLGVYDALHPYKHRCDSEVWADATPWEKTELDKLPYLVQAKQTQHVASKGLGRMELVSEYEPGKLRVGELLQLSYGLDDVAREIGFEPPPPQYKEDVSGGEI